MTKERPKHRAFEAGDEVEVDPPEELTERDTACENHGASMIQATNPSGTAIHNRRLRAVSSANPAMKPTGWVKSRDSITGSGFVLET